MSNIPDNIINGAIRCLDESRAISFAKIHSRFPDIVFAEGSGMNRRPLWQRYDNLVIIAPQAIATIMDKASAADLAILAKQVIKSPTALAIALVNGLNQNLFQQDFFRMMIATDLTPMSMLLDAGIDLSFLALDTKNMTPSQRETRDFVRDNNGLAMLLLNTANRNLDECEIIIRQMAKNGYPLDLGKPVIKCIGNNILKDKAFDTMILLMRSGYQFQQDDLSKASKYLDDTQMAEISKNSIKVAIRDAVAKQEAEEAKSPDQPTVQTSSRRSRIDL